MLFWRGSNLHFPLRQNFNAESGLDGICLCHFSFEFKEQKFDCIKMTIQSMDL